jgi:hypothetical protein
LIALIQSQAPVKKGEVGHKSFGVIFSGEGNDCSSELAVIQITLLLNWQRIKVLIIAKKSRVMAQKEITISQSSLWDDNQISETLSV